MGVRKGKAVSRIATMHTLALVAIVGILLCAPNTKSQELSRRIIEAEYQGCVDDLLMVDDGDLELKTTEYLPFIALRSAGRLEYADYEDLPLSLIAAFNFAACFCAMVLPDDQCCVGDKANINLNIENSPIMEDIVSTFCLSVDTSILTLLPDTPSPTMAPRTATPTVSPTLEVPIVEATPIPTMSPTPGAIAVAPSASPTSQNELCVTFQYGIENKGGFVAQDIMNMTNNTLKIGLVIATENVTIGTLNESFPAKRRFLRHWERREARHAIAGSDSRIGRLLPTHGLIVPLDVFSSRLPPGFIIEAPDSGVEGDGRYLAYLPQSLHQGSSLPHLSRKLVFYNDAFPPEIKQIIDNPFCPSLTTAMTKCQVVTSSVCVFLEAGDDPTEVRSMLTRGIQASIQSGAFEEAIPEKHRLP